METLIKAKLISQELWTFKVPLTMKAKSYTLNVNTNGQTLDIVHGHHSPNSPTHHNMPTLSRQNTPVRRELSRTTSTGKGKESVIEHFFLEICN